MEGGALFGCQGHTGFRCAQTSGSWPLLDDRQVVGLKEASSKGGSCELRDTDEGSFLLKTGMEEMSKYERSSRMNDTRVKPVDGKCPKKMVIGKS